MTFVILIIRKGATELILLNIKQMFKLTMYCTVLYCTVLCCTYRSAAGYCI